MNSNFSIVFTSILLEAMPFMLLGSFFSGLLEEFVSKDKLISLLPRNVWISTAIAGLAGLVLPVCECAVVPVVKRLAAKGLPAQACVAYLLAAPIVNPFVIASTAIAYRLDMHMAILRTLFGYLIAISAALLIGRLFKGSSAFSAGFLLGSFSSPATCSCGHSHGDSECAQERVSFTKRLMRSLLHASEDFIAVGPYLVAGALVAALACAYVDRKAFLALSNLPFAASALMIALAFLLNLCSQADAFVAASFNGLVPLSSQMAFMLIGPILDLKLLLMYRTLFKKKAIFCLALSSLALVVLAAFAMSFFDGGAR